MKKSIDMLITDIAWGLGWEELGVFYIPDRGQKTYTKYYVDKDRRVNHTFFSLFVCSVRSDIYTHCIGVYARKYGLGSGRHCVTVTDNKKCIAGVVEMLDPICQRQRYVYRRLRERMVAAYPGLKEIGNFLETHHTMPDYPGEKHLGPRNPLAIG